MGPVVSYRRWLDSRSEGMCRRCVSRQVKERTSCVQQKQAAATAFNYTSDLASGGVGIC